MATAEEYRNNMLIDVSNDYDKTVGSFIYDSIAPVAIQLVNMDASIEIVKSKLSIENLSGDELAARVNERTGITRKPATKATGTITVTGNGVITIGNLFETTNGIQFAATETKTITLSGTVNIAAVVTGLASNIPANQITLIPVTISGITAVNNSLPTIGGFEAESDTDLKKRYHENIRNPETDNNKAHYRNLVNGITGVGDSLIVPLWNGNNTFKVIIIGSDKKPASTQLVTDVQNFLDPNKDGLGNNAVGFGVYCTVVSAVGVNINVSFTLVKDSAYTLAQVTANVNTAIIEYLKSIAFVPTITSVSYAKISNAILDAQGVIDHSNLTVNSGTANVVIPDTQIAILGVVTIA